MSSSPCRLVSLCCVILAAGVLTVNGDSADSASLLARVNGVASLSKDGTKTQRSVIYRDDNSRHQPDGYGGYGPLFPFEMRPPFASEAGRSHHLNDLSDYREYHPPVVSYAPRYKHQRPQHYRPAGEPYPGLAYVPHGHREPRPDYGPGDDPFLAVHHRVNAQFEPEHLPRPPAGRYPPPPPPEVHLVPLPPVYHAPPPPPPYHQPSPYAHEFPYSEPEEQRPPASRRPHAKALGTLNPAPFIAAIASAYQENEKNFGVHRQGKLAESGPGHRPFREHGLREVPAPRHRPAVPYPELGPLYSLATAGSDVSATALQPDGQQVQQPADDDSEDRPEE